MPGTSLLYRALARGANLILPLVAPLSPKLAAGDRARRDAVGRWRRWASAHRDPTRPLLWVHAPSVGEGLQALAVLEPLRARHADWQIVYTHFSPSAESLAARQPVDRADYLPYDTPPNVTAMLAALRPTALVFTKVDLWPELATRAAATGTRVGMIAATVSPVSGRTRWPSVSLTRPGYAALDAAAAISPDDAGRLATLGVPSSRIVVAGDPRFDSALDRVAATPTTWPLGRLTAGAPTLVAGSTWPADEEVIVGAWTEVRGRHPDARLVMVPHEPTAAHVARLSALLERAGHVARALSALGDEEPAPELVMVDRVGVLAGLYRGAAIGYVGGGFGRAGLHSVLEPAACGLPVLIGPRWQSSREAGLLLERGGAKALSEEIGTAIRDLAAQWSAWLDQPAERVRAGEAALAVVEGERGAALRNAELVERLMENLPTAPTDR